MILGFRVFNNTLFKTFIPCCSNLNTIVSLNPSSKGKLMLTPNRIYTETIAMDGEHLSEDEYISKDQNDHVQEDG